MERIAERIIQELRALLQKQPNPKDEKPEERMSGKAREQFHQIRNEPIIVNEAVEMTPEVQKKTVENLREISRERKREQEDENYLKYLEKSKRNEKKEGSLASLDKSKGTLASKEESEGRLSPDDPSKTGFLANEPSKADWKGGSDYKLRKNKNMKEIEVESGDEETTKEMQPIREKMTEIQREYSPLRSRRRENHSNQERKEPVTNQKPESKSQTGDVPESQEEIQRTPEEFRRKRESRRGEMETKRITENHPFIQEEENQNENNRRKYGRRSDEMNSGNERNQDLSPFSQKRELDGESKEIERNRTPETGRRNVLRRRTPEGTEMEKSNEVRRTPETNERGFGHREIDNGRISANQREVKPQREQVDSTGRIRRSRKQETPEYIDHEEAGMRLSGGVHAASAARLGGAYLKNDQRIRKIEPDDEKSNVATEKQRENDKWVIRSRPQEKPDRNQGVSGLREPKERESFLGDPRKTESLKSKASEKQEHRVSSGGDERRRQLESDLERRMEEEARRRKEMLSTIEEMRGSLESSEIQNNKSRDSKAIKDKFEDSKKQFEEPKRKALEEDGFERNNRPSRLDKE